MNLPKVTETLYEHGISHTMIAPHVIRINKLIDGASRPVLVFDCYTNRATVMPDYHKLSDKEAGRMENLRKRLKKVNVF